MGYLVKQSHRAPAVTAPVPVDESLPRACVIGAGSSGIAAAKHLYLAGIGFDCFEKGSDIGGTWVLDNSNGQSACYDTLEINTSCPRMAYSDFPMPADYPAYARHDQVRAYFEDYVDHFGFRRHDHLRHHRRGRLAHRGRALGRAGQRPRRHRDPHLRRGAGRQRPPLGRALAGARPTPATSTASRSTPTTTAAASSSRAATWWSSAPATPRWTSPSRPRERARTTTWSVRRSEWVLRKWFLGKPSDQGLLPPGWVPWWVTALRLRIGATTAGSMTKYGLPAPTHKPGQSHPVQSERIRERLAAGAVTARPAIERLDGDRVVFVDGTSAPADLIIWATGYRVSFPFLAPDARLRARQRAAAVEAGGPPRPARALLPRPAPADRRGDAAGRGAGGLDRRDAARRLRAAPGRPTYAARWPRSTGATPASSTPHPATRWRSTSTTTCGTSRASAGKDVPVLRRKVAGLALRAIRWKAVGEVPERGVLVGAPHTSNWDWVLTMLLAWRYGITIRLLVKQELFVGPLGWLLRRTGAVELDRTNPAATIKQLLAESEGGDPWLIGIAAEGTRSRGEHWKSGFYRIAQQTGLPITLAFLDVPSRTVGWGPTFHPTGDVRADMDVLREFYADKTGFRPENFTPPRLREEG